MSNANSSKFAQTKFSAFALRRSLEVCWDAPEPWFCHHLAITVWCAHTFFELNIDSKVRKIIIANSKPLKFYDNESTYL